MIARSVAEDLVPCGDEPQDDDPEQDAEQDAELCPGDAPQQVGAPQGGGDAQTEGHERSPLVRIEHGPQHEADRGDRQHEECQALPRGLREAVTQVGLPCQLVAQASDQGHGHDEAEGSTDVHGSSPLPVDGLGFYGQLHPPGQEQRGENRAAVWVSTISIALLLKRVK